MTVQAQFRLRLYRDATIAIGPGKVALLEAIAQTGSISAAAKRFNMSYRRAWLLVDEMNRALVSPAVSTAAGGAHGGGTRLTEVGQEIVARYRAIEAAAQAAAAEDIERLCALLSP